MPYRNRVTPFGDLIAVAERGALLGNRGILHDSDGRIVRRHNGKRWISCVLDFRGRHRVVMAPGAYTHLFFLDEATALAAGHRPCAECRRPDYDRFRRAWATAHGLDALPGADALDAALHAQRLPVDGHRSTWRSPLETLPDGVFVVLDDDREQAWLWRDGALTAWSPGGYGEVRSPAAAAPSGEVDVLTPACLVATLHAGYALAL